MHNVRPKIIVACKDDTLLRDIRRLLVEAEVLAFVNAARVPVAIKLNPGVRGIVIENVPSLTPLDVLDAARATAPSVRRVLVTEHCDLQLVIEGLHKGMFDTLLYRPLGEHELIEALDLSRPSARPATVIYPKKPLHQPR